MAYLEELFSLEGKVAIVTGASRGIGQAVAAAAVRAGAQSILVSANEERLTTASRPLVEEGLAAEPRACDLEDGEQIAALVDYVERQYGRIDVLVNAAGVTFGSDEAEYPDDLWEKTMRINLQAPFRLARGCARMMKEQRSGSIINITSVAAELGAPGNPSYPAAKGGLKQLTRALAVDLGPFGIRANCIGPGYFLTDMTRASWNDPEKRALRTGRTLLGRWGDPRDLAGLVVLLASDASSYITGQSIYADGGWLASLF